MADRSAKALSLFSCRCHPRQVAEAARQVLPGLKVLFITGYAEHAALRGVQLELGMQVMVKPFTMEALGSRINAMIGDD